MAGVAALVALVGAMVAVPLGATVAGAATTLTLHVGGMNDAGVEGQSFYPGVATITEGDSIQWRFRGAHTVNFYTPPGDPDAPGWRSVMTGIAAAEFATHAHNLELGADGGLTPMWSIAATQRALYQAEQQILLQWAQQQRHQESF